MRARSILLVSSLALLSLTSIAAANPPAPVGGGGPSASAPAYDPTADYKAGIDAMLKNDYRAANRHFDNVLNALPRDSNVLLLSGLAKAGANDMRGAQRAYERSVRADQKNVDARRELGLLYAKNGDAKKAGQELAALKTQLTACNSACPNADKLKVAVNALETAIATPKPAAAAPSSMIFANAKTGDASYLTAIGLVNTHRYEEAIAQLKTAELAFGPHPDVLTYLGFSNRKLGRLDEAERYYQAALKVAPEHKGATEYYGELKIERGDLAGAKQMLARLTEICAFGCAEEQELRRWLDAAERS